MVATLKGAGILSQETGIEVNTLSKPDEIARVRKEEEEIERKTIAQEERNRQVAQQREEGQVEE